MTRRRSRALLVALAVTALGTGFVALMPSLAQAAPTRYEAESATLSQATVASNHTGFSGTGFVDYTNVAGGFIEWSFDAPAAGSATAVLRYANGTGADRPMDITVNGTVAATGVPFAPTANWDTWTDATIPVTLKSGANVIRATATGTSGGPNVDKLSVSGVGTGGPDNQAPSAPPGNRHSG